MLSKGRRIKTAFFSRSTPFSSLHGHSLSARVSFLKENQGAKVAVIVSKKVAKSSVERNRIRRRVYGAIQKPISDLPQGTYILLYPKKEITLASYQDIEADIRHLVKDIQQIALKKHPL